MKARDFAEAIVAVHISSDGARVSKSLRYRIVVFSDVVALSSSYYVRLDGTEVVAFDLAETLALPN